MYTIPRFLFDSRIYNLVEGFVIEGFESYSALSGAEKDDIVCKIIEVLGNDSYSLLIDHEDFDQTMNLFSSFLRTAKAETAYDLLHKMRKNAHQVYEYDLNQLFYEVIAQVDHERSAEA